MKERARELVDLEPGVIVHLTDIVESVRRGDAVISVTVWEGDDPAKVGEPIRRTIIRHSDDRT